MGSRLLGEGSEGKVFVSYSALRGEVLLKVFKKKNSFEQEKKISIAIGSYCEDLQQLISFNDAEKTLIYKYRSGGTCLIDYLIEYDLSENFLKDLLFNIVNAVRNLHDLEILHLDIKPDNIIVFEDASVLLIDYGLSHFLNEKFAKSRGTYQYMAPEIINLEATEKSDIYSLGITFYVIIEKKYPPKDLRKFFFRDMVDEDPSKRPSLDEVESLIECYFDRI